MFLRIFIFWPFLAIFLLLFKIRESEGIEGKSEDDPNIPNTIPVIKRCCPPNQEFNFLTKKCISTGNPPGPKEKEGVENEDRILIPSMITIEGNDLQFRLVEETPYCFKENDREFEKFEDGDEEAYTLFDENGLAFIEKRYHHIEIHHLKEAYSTDSYCIETNFNGQNESFHKINLCKPFCNKDEPCLRKCCNIGEGIKHDGECVPISKEIKWNPSFHTKKDFKSKIPSDVKPFYEIEKPNCEWYALNIVSHGRIPKFILLPNQTLIFYNESHRKWESKHYNKTVFCVDYFVQEEDECPYIPWTNNKDNYDDMLYLCINESEDFKKLDENHFVNANYSLRGIWTKLCLLVGQIFLFLTAVIYTVYTVGSKKKTIHSWTLIAYVLSLFLFFFFFTFIHFINPTTISNNGCIFLGIVAHFFILMSFSWLCVINYDIFDTFRILKISNKSAEFRKFKWYIVFATLVPVSILAISISYHTIQQNRMEIMESYDFLKGVEVDISPGSTYHCSNETIKVEVNNTRCYVQNECAIDTTIYPSYGVTNCFISSDSMIPYLYVPIWIFLFINFIFFVCTTLRILYLQKNTKIASKSKSKKNLDLCKLYMKLFIVMGISWNLEVFNIAFNNGEWKDNWIFAVFDTINILQGIPIFIIFVCKREIIYHFQQRYKILTKIPIGPSRSFRRPSEYSTAATGASTMRVSTMNSTTTTSSKSKTPSRGNSFELTPI